jgi:osmotically-inducible protein OsmY
MRTFATTSALWVLIGFVTLPGQLLAQRRTADSSSVSQTDDRVQTSADHHYQNPAQRAKDDLLITEVKSDLAKDGVADDQPVAVDCDHGKIRLSGVIGSAADARHAGDIAADAPGVVAVVNQLTWRK